MSMAGLKMAELGIDMVHAPKASVGQANLVREPAFVVAKMCL
jgi:hypothetical protein